MAGMARIVSGVLLILLGAWGAVVAFVGPYFHYAYTPDKAWAYNSGRLWLSRSGFMTTPGQQPTGAPSPPGRRWRRTRSDVLDRLDEGAETTSDTDHGGAA